MDRFSVRLIQTRFYENSGFIANMIDLQSLPVKIASVLDFQFLEGYNDPTILLLYEALPTWTGRVTERQDTCGMVALSINLIDETHPVIWQMAGLPYDSSAWVRQPDLWMEPVDSPVTCPTCQSRTFT